MQLPFPPDDNSRGIEHLSFPPIDRRTLLKIAGAATLAAPGFTLLQGLSGNGAVAMGATAGSDSVAAAAGPATVTLGGADVRPPSIPLAVRSPYLSSWLPGPDQNLTSTTPQFWNGDARGLAGLALIDGDLYAWAGQPTVNGNAVTAMTPTSTEVTATRSIFTATTGDGSVELVAEWLSPVEPADLELQSAPLTLLTVSVSFTDGGSHDVQVYADITGEWASNSESAQIEWQTTSDSTGRYWAVELQSQVPLAEPSNMASWGTVIWAAPAAGPSLTYQSGYSTTLRDYFGTNGALANSSDPDFRAINNDQPAFAFAFNFGTTAGSTSLVLGHVRTPLISYGSSATPLLPLWTQYWPGAWPQAWQQMTADFITGAPAARQRAIALDAQIETDATAAAGSGYAAACALALRQCYGGTELAIGPNGDPWLLGKEISSDGDTNTVDIFDQAFLAWLYLDPDLIPLVMAPILDWCASPAWQDASAWTGISQPYYCVHDLGPYPVASGRVPGNGEQMPIEESAGMLIMAAAYANMVGAAAAQPFLSQWQSLWTQWADYLQTQVPTPATQLCTDDWAPTYSTSTGSVNLGIKAIIGLAAAAEIATILGDSANATTWWDAATNNIDPWVSLSTDATAGNYLNVVQGATDTWSCLYNAYYQAVIGLSLVPEQVAYDQATFYLNQLPQLNTPYGMPLQTAANDVNKVAWLFYLPAWLDSYPIADELMSRNVAYINGTTSFVPYGDRYNTNTGIETPNIEAHPTLGAVFALLAAEASPASDNVPPTPSAAPQPTPTPTPTPVSVTVTKTAPPKPVLTLSVSDGTLKLSGKDVRIHLRSAGAARCQGSLKLVYTHEVTLKHHKHKREKTVIGHVNYSLPADSSRTVKIKLTAAGLKWLKDAKNHRLSVVLEATVKGGKSTSKRTTIHSTKTH